ncbi:MAG: NrfD/PsrC family molybdoenzyme membrane anchor subunit [Archaeoglobaceae archaeon]
MKPKEITFFLALLFLVAIGFIGAYQMHFQPIMPMEPFESAIGYPWRLLVAIYVFLVLIGTAAIASAGEVLRVKELESILKEAILIAIVTIAVGLVTIAMDLERIERGSYALLGHANATSVMYWMIMFYVLELLFLILEGWFVFRSDLIKQSERKDLKGFIAKLISLRFLGRFFAKPNKSLDMEFAKAIGLLALLTAILAYSNLGALFSATHLALWNDASNPVYFIITAIISGSAMLIFAIVVTSWIKGEDSRKLEALPILSKILLFSLLSASLFVLWKYVIIGYPAISADGSFSVQNILFGKFALNFWFLEIFVGIVVPVLILSFTRKNMDALFVASFLALVGIFAFRVDFVFSAQVVKTISGVSIPTSIHIFEAMFAVGALALALLLYYVLYKILPMEVEHEA